VSTLTLVPIDLASAQAFVAQHHRHHGKVCGHKFSLAVADETGEVRGVCIVGRPVARGLQDGWTLEVTRCCTDGIHNGCSMLYGAAWRAARALGYKRLVTYILATETGVSLQAAGWKCIGECGGGSWSCKSRPRVDKHPTLLKLRWEAQ